MWESTIFVFIAPYEPHDGLLYCNGDGGNALLLKMIMLYTLSKAKCKAQEK
jgi:hypothetical protein